jgi:polysaccharide export outer membrane protein
MFNFRELFILGMRRIIVFTILFIIFLLMGCTSVAKNPTPLNSIRTQTPPSQDQDYRIQVGDQLDIKFFFNPELNEQITVRPDGRLSLQLAHEIMAAGLTPAQLKDVLTEKYADELQQPEITVIVRSFGTQKVYVDGEVVRPGMIPLSGLMTILQAISQAGGVKYTARTSDVVVIRRDASDKPLAFSVNLQRIINGTDMSQDIALNPFDIIYVPKSPIANMNVWVDQYIRKNIPLGTGFGYNINP